MACFGPGDISRLLLRKLRIVAEDDSARPATPLLVQYLFQYAGNLILGCKTFFNLSFG